MELGRPPEGADRPPPSEARWATVDHRGEMAPWWAGGGVEQARVMEDLWWK